jgi:hypothetical protein
MDREKRQKTKKMDEMRTVNKNPIGTGMEIAEEEKNSEWSIINRRSNGKGKRTSPDR